MGDFFDAWARFALSGPYWTPAENLVTDYGISLSENEVEAYNAPFPGIGKTCEAGALMYRAGPRSLPSMMHCLDVEKNLEAWESLCVSDAGCDL